MEQHYYLYKFLDELSDFSRIEDYFYLFSHFFLYKDDAIGKLLVVTC